MTADNILGKDDRPRFFAVGNAAALGLGAPEPRHGVAVRSYVRSLAGMQKEALIASSATGSTWRLTCDEGPYLAGHDEAPFPLAFMGAGMAASFFTEIAALAERRGVAVDGLRLVLDNRYTMEGSALRGTMVGGALPPELTVEIDAGAADVDLHSLCADALSASALHGLVREPLTSLFTATCQGRPLPLGRVSALGVPPLPDPRDSFDAVTVGGPAHAAELIARTATAAVHDGEGGKGSSLQADQKRTLHVRSSCTSRPDGVKDIEVSLFKPSGSSFRFLSDEPAGRRALRAPDAATLVAAGIAFCFMTQFGRYAAITRKRLDGYRTVQDTHLSAGGASFGSGRAGRADPVETHVHLDTPEGEEFARTLVDMGEQTCFLHALCRNELKPALRVQRASR